MKARVAGNCEQATRTAAIGSRAHCRGRRARHQMKPAHRRVDDREGRAAQRLGRREVDAETAPGQDHELEDDERQAEGNEQLGHVAELVDAAQADALEQRAERADHEGRDDQARPEADEARDRVGDVAAQHVEAGVRKVEHAHHAEDERQPRAQHEEQQPVAQAVEHRNGEELHRSRSVGAARPKQKRPESLALGPRSGTEEQLRTPKAASSGSSSACWRRSSGTRRPARTSSRCFPGYTYSSRPPSARR